jgi:hypothetical protein
VLKIIYSLNLMRYDMILTIQTEKYLALKGISIVNINKIDNNNIG